MAHSRPSAATGLRSAHRRIADIRRDARPQRATVAEFKGIRITDLGVEIAQKFIDNFILSSPSLQRPAPDRCARRGCRLLFPRDMTCASHLGRQVLKLLAPGQPKLIECAGKIDQFGIRRKLAELQTLLQPLSFGIKAGLSVGKPIPRAGQPRPAGQHLPVRAVRGGDGLAGCAGWAGAGCAKGGAHTCSRG